MSASRWPQRKAQGADEADVGEGEWDGANAGAGIDVEDVHSSNDRVGVAEVARGLERVGGADVIIVDGCRRG